MTGPRAALAALALSACVPVSGGGEGPAGAPLPQAVTVSSAGIAVTAPPGYCLDEMASETGVEAAFAAFRRCEVLRGADLPTSDRAVLTVSVSPTPNAAPVIAGSEDRLVSYFRTAAGATALSRTGDAATVSLLQAFARDGAVWLQVRDAAPAQGLDPTYWRVLLDVKGRIATVTVSGYAAQPMSAARARALAEQTVARLRAGNPAGVAATRAAPADFPGFPPAAARL